MIDGDFYWRAIYNGIFVAPQPPYLTNFPNQPLQPNPILRWLWNKAKAEWK